MNRKISLTIFCCMMLYPEIPFAAGDNTHAAKETESDQSAGKTMNPPVAPDESPVYRCCTSSGMFPRYVDPDDRAREVAKEGSFCLAVMPSGQHIPGIVCHG